MAELATEQGMGVVEEQAPVEQVVDNSDPLDGALDDGFPERHPLSEKVEEVPEPTAEEVVVEKVEETPAPTAEPVVETPSNEDLQKQIEAFKAKALDETRKRQALEQQKPPVEFNWDNPQETIQTLKNEISGEFQDRFMKMSAVQAASRHDDYQEKYDTFLEMANRSPSLANEVANHPDPAEHMYQLAKKEMFTAEVGSNPEEYKAKLEAEIRTKIEAEYKNKDAARQNLANSLPPAAKTLGNKVASEVVSTGDPLDGVFDDHPS